MTPHFPAAHPVQGSSAFAVAVLWVGFVLALTGVADGQNGNRTLEPTDGEANARLVERGVGTPTDREVTVLDRIWELPKLYRNDNGPIIQEISLIGRYHGQLWGVDSSQGSINEWEDRRMRAGARIRLLDGFTIASNFELDAKENASTAEYIDTLTLGWTHAEKFQVLVGQQKPGFTYEYSISSNRILTIERSLLVNQLVPDKAPGVMVEQVLGKFHYQLGAYSGQPIDDRLSNPFGLVALEYDLSEWSERDQMAVQVFYLYNSEVESKLTEPYRHSISLSTDFEDGPNSFLGQFIYADGFEKRPDVWGFTLMPARFIRGDKLQVVARYQFARSTGEGGLQVQNRYESRVPGLMKEGLGDRYHAGYLGLNYYIYGNRLKVMTGIEYSDMRGGKKGGDFAGWTGFAGLRLFF